MSKKTEKLEGGEVAPPPVRPPYPKFDNLGANAPSFEDYFDSHIGVIRDVQAMLARALDDDPLIMDSQIREAESRLGIMKSIESWSDSYLDVAEHLELGKMPERSSDFTDLDRSTALAAAVARQRRFRNIVRGMVESIESRISYGQSRLRMIERNHG